MYSCNNCGGILPNATRKYCSAPDCRKAFQRERVRAHRARQKGEADPRPGPAPKPAEKPTDGQPWTLDELEAMGWRIPREPELRSCRLCGGTTWAETCDSGHPERATGLAPRWAVAP